MRAIAFSLVLTAVLSTGAMAAVRGPVCDACDEPPVAALEQTDIGHGALIGDVPIVADILRSLRGPSSAVEAATPVSTVTASAQPAPQTASKTDPDQLICESAAITGSRITSTVCFTKRRWDQIRESARHFTGEYN